MYRNPRQPFIPFTQRPIPVNRTLIKSKNVNESEIQRLFETAMLGNVTELKKIIKSIGLTVSDMVDNEGKSILHIIIENENLVSRVATQSPAWHEALKKLAKKYPAIIKEIRGQGYMVGVAMNIDPVPVVAALREAGLLAVPASGIAIRLLPPLNASVAELNEAVEIFDRVLSAWKVA